MSSPRCPTYCRLAPHGFRLIAVHLYRDMSQLLEGEERKDFVSQAQQIFEELGVKGEG